MEAVTAQANNFFSDVRTSLTPLFDSASQSFTRVSGTTPSAVSTDAHNAIVSVIPVAARAAWGVCGLVGALSLGTYYIPSVYVKLFHRVQNLKKKYNAKWALVTGGSSGIGLAIVEALAEQGLHVVVVAYPDKVLDDAVENLKKKFPTVQFRKVGLNLGVPGGIIPPLEEATKDIDVQLVFNNAGYIIGQLFTNIPASRQLTNYHCNATAGVEITHHYVSKLQAKGLKGCVCFTSSPAGMTPTPTSVLYGSTKSFVTSFAMSLAPELYPDGIDVCVVHPSPVATSFYDTADPRSGPINFFKKTATTPRTIADALLASVGRTVIRDQGYYPWVLKFVMKMLDVNLMADIANVATQTNGEYQMFKNEKKTT